MLSDDVQGYLDGRDPDSPEPSQNRSAIYRHCFEVGRREAEGRHWLAPVARARAKDAREEDAKPFL